MDGKKNWYVVDGWIPQKELQKDSPLEGHEALIILNCNAQDAVCYLDFYFEDKDPIENVKLVVPAKRVKCFRLDKPEDIGGVNLGRLVQYSFRVRSEIEIVVQFGRMDVTQPNCAYIGVMGYSE